MKLLQPIGRIAFAVPMFIFGVFHFMSGQDMSGMVPGFFPFPLAMVYITGVALILASVSIVINIKARLASILLAAMLLIFVLTIHLPSIQSSQMVMTALLKDLALAGGALVIASVSKN